MKKYFSFLLLVGLGFLCSCNNDFFWQGPFSPNNPEEESLLNLEISPCDEGVEVDPNDVPQAILDYLDTNFPDIPIDEVELFDLDGEAVYGIELENDLHILFDQNGLVITSGNVDDDEVVPIDSLLQSIIDYVGTNYQGASIESASFEVVYGVIFFEIHLTDGTEVYFDLDGNFICLDEENDDDDDDGHDDDDEEEEDDDDSDDDDDGDDDDEIEDLPENIVDYINTNFPDYEIEEAEMEELCDSTMVYEVELEDGEEELELFFDLDGNFLYSEIEASFSDLPAAVVTALETTYPDYTIDNDEVYILEFADGTIQYEVELYGNNDEEFEVILSADGSIICENNS
jgi:hypothetical protein